MKKLTGLMAAVGLLLTLAMPAAATHEGGAEHESGGDKVILCHATNSLDNPFVAIEISVSGLGAHQNPGDPPTFHVNAKTGLRDFLLEGSGLDACDDTPDVVTPLAPTVSAATCPAPGTLTLTAVEGVVYTITPAYTAGVSSGNFTVTATADLGYVIAAGATTTFNVTVPAALNCVSGLAPSVSAGTCVAPGALTLTAVNGVTYTVSPAYSAGASGTFTVTAAAAPGFTLTGANSFVVNVPAKLVCNTGTQGGTGGPSAPPVRSGTQGSTGGPAGVPNTATELPSNQLAVAIGGLFLVASLVSFGAMRPAARRNRR